jgi:protein PhnA
MNVRDSNGTPLTEGDSVTLIKDLKVKGSSLTLKRGKLVKNIRLTSKEDEIEGRVEGSQIVLRTEFLKKVT